MKILDFYGQPIRISLNKNPLIKSNLGGFFSILTVICVVVSGFLIGQDIFSKSKPWFFVYVNIGNEVIPISISGNKELPIAIEVQKKLGNSYRDDTVLKYNLYLTEWIYDPLSTEILQVNQWDLKLKNCTFSDWSYNIKESKYTNWGLNDKLCFDYNNASLSGSTNEDHYKFLKFEVSRCTNVTNNNCKSNKEIDDIITNEELTLNLFYTYTAINMTNNKEPTNNTVHQKTNFLMKDRNKRIMVELEPATINTDNGFLFEADEEKIYFNLNFKETDMKVRSENNPVLITYMFGSSNISFYYSRSYIKVTDIFAKLGGLIKSITLFFIIIINLIDYVEKTRATINEVFILKDLEKENNKENFEELENKRESNFILNRLTKSINKRNSDLGKSYTSQLKSFEDSKIVDDCKSNFQKTLERIIDRKKSHDLILSFKDTYNILCYNKKRKYELDFQKKLFFFKTCWDRINQCLDLKTFFQKFEEITILKKILLNQNQLNMLDKLIKPCIKYKSEVENVGENLKEEEILKNFLDNIHPENNLIDRNILNLI
jgi:hypothetical protein